MPPPTKLQIPAALLIRHPATLLSSRDHHRVEPASSSPNLDELAEPASHSPMEQSQSNSQPQDNAAQNSQTGSSRGKSDPAWQYFTVKYDKNNKAQYTCIFCLNTYNGGGIYRMKYHLAKIAGQIKVCNKVTEDVELQFKRLLEENKKKNKAEKRKFTSDCYDVESEREAEEEDGGDVELDVDFPNVADSSNTASFGGTSDDGGFGLPVYDGDVGTLNDNYDF
ncbi:hypothetical protein Ahy_B06g083761 [Arachis hypogaea]|uniref:BED-type domain-containing protein n=1 Tax=Arachis hypogaea TaxID=3818 RepID=A0A444YQJ7_ARAHY|nr:hypothetical protein Ahy_B06g083761 [Arachis hypogaea]